MQDVIESIVAPQQLRAMADLALTAPPGAIAEVGVYKGGSAAYLYEVAQKQDRELHLFDTFTGTPVSIEGLDKHKVNDEFRPPADTELRLRDLLPLAFIYPGVYPGTHPEDLPPLAFIHVDCDQYDSYKAVIKYMWPLVVPGGMMIFDDYPYLAGAKKAVEEHFAAHELKKCHTRYYVVK